MSTQRQPFHTFLDELRGATVAIVYSFSNRVNPSEAWYDRWRSDVIFFFGQGVEKLEAEPRYLDVEQYLSLQSKKDDAPGDYIINLHSGLNDIGCWPIISAFARWRRIPVAPCSSDVHIVGERKDLSNMLAESAGLLIPEPFSPKTNVEALFVRKPRDLGMSRGLQILRHSELNPESLGTDIVQHFVKGFDATVGVIRKPDGNYVVIGAQLLVPIDPTDDGWVFGETDKIEEGKSESPFSRRSVQVHSELQRAICLLCERVGPSAHYRLDFRVVPNEDETPSTLTLSNSVFLEANPTPTVSKDGDFAAMIVEWTESGGLASAINGAASERLEDLGTEATLVALSLYSASESMAFR